MEEKSPANKSSNDLQSSESNKQVELSLDDETEYGIDINDRNYNAMSKYSFCRLMKIANTEQKSLIHHVISHIVSQDPKPLQLFISGPAGTGKTFLLSLIADVYNRFSIPCGYNDAYVAAAPTNKTAYAIKGYTVDEALKMILNNPFKQTTTRTRRFRSQFQTAKVLIVDEVNMISAKLLALIDERLRSIRNSYNKSFGGLDVIFFGDLRQLTVPTLDAPIYQNADRNRWVYDEPPPYLWQSLEHYELTQVMRQSDKTFSTLLTKLGSGLKLNSEELMLLESRFCTKEEAIVRCPRGMRVFHSVGDTYRHNEYVLQQEINRVVSTSIQFFIGYENIVQRNFTAQELNRKSLYDTKGLPDEIVFVIGRNYMITKTIDVAEGLIKGTIGELVHLELNNENVVTRVWLLFENSPEIGHITRENSVAYLISHNIHRLAVPIVRETCTIFMSRDRTQSVKRNHFPLVSACAVSYNHLQGETLNEVVYDYKKWHPLNEVYFILSRVTSLEGLFLTSASNDFKFYHGREDCTSRQCQLLKIELQRLAKKKMETNIADSVIHLLNK